MVGEEEQRAGRATTSEQRIECLEGLMRRFGIDSVLIGVPKLARALGMGSSTLYAYMRAGTFFMPYRVVNGTPMVKVDDLIDWYLNGEVDVRRGATSGRATPGAAAESPSEPPASDQTRRGRKRRADDGSGGRRVEFGVADVLTKEDADSAVDSVVATVLARMERLKALQ